MQTQCMAVGPGGGRALRVFSAQAVHERMRGLLGRPPLAADEGLLIRPCRLVHTFGMRYAIDIVFLDRRGVVRQISREVPRGTVRGCWRAWQTLELAAGSATQFGLQVGDTLPVATRSP